MFALIKKALAVAFGLVVMAGQAAQATTINVGDLPTDGSTLAFFGNLAPPNGDIHSDIYNFVLPFDVLGTRPTGPAFFHLGTGNAGFVTVVSLFTGFDLAGDFLALSEISTTLTQVSFGPCHGSFNECSGFHTGARTRLKGFTDVLRGITLLAGNYSAHIVGGIFGAFGDPGITGEYELRFTSRAPSTASEPGTLALLALGLAGIGFSRRKAA
jgi:hypothetical protein